MGRLKALSSTYTKQCLTVYIDLVNQLHKKDLSYDRIKQEIDAQVPKDRGPKDPDPMRSASFVAEQFGVVYVHSLDGYISSIQWLMPISQCAQCIYDGIRLDNHI